MKALGFFIMILGGMIDAIQLFMVIDGMNGAENFNFMGVIGTVLFLIGLALVGASHGDGAKKI